MSKKTFYVTTPLYYVNAKPHLGTLYSTLLADVAARWHRFSGDEVFFLTGTDEHGQKIADAAAAAGTTPKAFADTVVPRFKEAWERYGITHDHFIRTTDDAHKKTVLAWIEKLQAQGDIYKDSYEGLYCVPCETFVTPEQVVEKEGEQVCPSCARGLQTIAEENYFFRLSAYQEKLLAFYEKNPDFIQPKERINEVLSFVKSGLRDLSLSRKSVSWGIPFLGDPEHTVYVWGDALMNYVSALGFLQEDDARFTQFWRANLQVMAKDIVKFHAVFFPAFLMAAGIDPAQQLLVHGYLLVDNDKMSKSKGNACDPLEMADAYGVDQVRYYLTRHMPTTQDGNFSLEEMAQRIGSDLANSLGNLLQRTASLALKYGATDSLPPAEWSDASAALREQCGQMIVAFSDAMDANQFSVAYAALWKFIGQVNAYFHEQQPWKVAKEERNGSPSLVEGPSFSEIIAAGAQSLYVIAHLIAPVMPFKAQQLLAALGHTTTVSREELRSNNWATRCTLHVPQEPLFIRPEVPKKESLAETKKMSEKELSKEATNESMPKTEAPAVPQTPDNVITFDYFLKVELVVGQIIACESVPKSKKLYQMQVDMGSYGTRQILAGIAQFFAPEDLIGKRGTFVANLAPRQMMGTYSEGMMMVGKDGDKMSLLSVSDDIAVGTRLG
ncbi:MAG: methionine--tRNA ligase [Candidatus Dependentiae bacterium]|jgi:methionyl-tRNA synthetase